MDRTLLVSDLDGTLLGDDSALAQFADWCQERRDQLVLAYSSGRLYDSIQESIRTTRLPEPDFIVGGVGTQMRRPQGETIATWEEMPLDRWDREQIRELLSAVPELVPQPEEYQSSRKLSYFLHDAAAADLARLRELLLEAGLKVDLLYSSQRDLDIVPTGLNKGSAAAFLAREVATDCERVLVAGDTGNDLAMFLQDFLGIVVANAHRELKALAGPRVYLSPRSYAAGVLDGIEYWLREETGV